MYLHIGAPSRVSLLFRRFKSNHYRLIWQVNPKGVTYERKSVSAVVTSTVPSEILGRAFRAVIRRANVTPVRARARERERARRIRRYYRRYARTHMHARIRIELVQRSEATRWDATVNARRDCVGKRNVSLTAGVRYVLHTHLQRREEEKERTARARGIRARRGRSSGKEDRAGGRTTG